MERLTVKTKKGWRLVSEKMCDGDDLVFSAINRLAELEDKLESGQAVELKCKAGDMIFVPYVYEKQCGIMRLIVDIIQISNCGPLYCTEFETFDNVFAIKFNNGMFSPWSFNKIWFTDEARAKARLKELQVQHDED